MPIPILMPALSPTMEDGTLAKWMVKEGDSVAPGDILAEIETDKATMEVEAVDEGVGGELEEVPPAGIVLGQQNEVKAPVGDPRGGALPAVTGGHVRLDTKNGLDPDFVCLYVELHCPVHIAVIG